MPRPSWVTALAIGQWYEIPNTNIASVDPSPTPSGSTGPSAKIDAWCGLAMDHVNSKLYSVAGGGHSDYAGNEVDVLDLSVATPGWVQLLAPTSNANLLNGAYYADGRPSSRHTYYGSKFIEQDNRIMQFSGVCWSDGTMVKQVSSYDIAGNSFNASGTHPDIPNPPSNWLTNNVSVSTVTVDPATGNVYLSAGDSGDHVLWTRATNTWSTVAGGGGVGLGSVSAMSGFDTTRGRFLVVSDFDHFVYTVGSNAWSSVTFTGAEAATIQVREGGMIYVPSLDAYIVRIGSAGGGAIYKIDASTFACTAYTTSGGASIPGSGGANPTGPFNKFIYAPNLGGAVFYPVYGGNAWFLKLEADPVISQLYRMGGMVTLATSARR